MHKQTITYEDFEGRMQTEDFYFNISRAKIIDMALTGEAQDLFETIQSAVKDEDGAAIIRLMRDLIEMSYGEKQADGKTFRQNEQLSSDFIQSQPYDAMFYEFTLDPPKALTFIEALFPAQLMADAIEKAKTQGKTLEELGQEAFPVFQRPPTQDRLPKQVKNLSLPRDDGQAYYDASKAERLRRQSPEKPQPSSALQQVRQQQKWEMDTLDKFDGFDPGEVVDVTLALQNAGFDDEQIAFLRRSDLI